MNLDTHSHQAILKAFPDRLRESERFHMGSGKVYETLEALAADLSRERIDYAIVGGMALNAHGYRRETVDVDVLVRPEGLQAFHDTLVGKGYLPAFAGARKTFMNTRTGTKVEFLTTGEYPGDGKPKPVAFPDPVAVSIDIKGIRIIDLPDLVNMKLASGMTQPARRRDLADVQDLIRTLSLTEDFVDSIHPYVRESFLMLLGEIRNDTSGTE